MRIQLLVAYVTRLLRENLAGVPLEYDADFARELTYVNLHRLRFIAAIFAFFFLVFIICVDLTLTGFRYLLVLHILAGGGFLLLLFLSFIAKPLSPTGITRWHHVLVLVTVGFSLLMATAIVSADQLGAYQGVTAYVFACFGAATAIYFRPRTSLVLFSLSYVLFVLGMAHFQKNPGTLVGHYANGTMTVLVAWVVSAILFRARVADFVNRKTIEQQKAGLEKANQMLLRLSSLDSLTGIANRRSFDEVLTREWLRTLRDTTPISLVLIDVDFFKPYNDTYGHQAGDDCLRQVASTLDTVVKRPGDVVARWGGEEFAVILPDTDIKGAAVVAEALRAAVEDLRIEHFRSSSSRYLTISLGVATVVPDHGSSPEKLIAAADKALYQAKHAGGNRVVLGGPVAEQGRLFG